MRIQPSQSPVNTSRSQPPETREPQTKQTPGPQDQVDHTHIASPSHTGTGPLSFVEDTEEDNFYNFESYPQGQNPVPNVQARLATAHDGQELLKPTESGFERGRGFSVGGDLSVQDMQTILDAVGSLDTLSGNFNSLGNGRFDIHSWRSQERENGVTLGIGWGFQANFQAGMSGQGFDHLNNAQGFQESAETLAAATGRIENLGGDLETSAEYQTLTTYIEHFGKADNPVSYEEADQARQVLYDKSTGILNSLDESIAALDEGMDILEKMGDGEHQVLGEADLKALLGPYVYGYLIKTFDNGAEIGVLLKSSISYVPPLPGDGLETPFGTYKNAMFNIQEQMNIQIEGSEALYQRLAELKSHVESARNDVQTINNVLGDPYGELANTYGGDTKALGAALETSAGNIQSELAAAEPIVEGLTEGVHITIQNTVVSNRLETPIVVKPIEEISVYARLPIGEHGHFTTRAGIRDALTLADVSHQVYTFDENGGAIEATLVSEERQLINPDLLPPTLYAQTEIGTDTLGTRLRWSHPLTGADSTQFHTFGAGAYLTPQKGPQLSYAVTGLNFEDGRFSPELNHHAGIGVGTARWNITTGASLSGIQPEDNKGGFIEFNRTLGGPRQP